MYSGGVQGLAATSSSSAAERRRGSAKSLAIQQYSAYLKQQSRNVASQVLGSADSIRHYYTWVVAGFAAGPLTSRQVAALRKHVGVQAVFPDQLFKASTISTPRFLELDTVDGVWPQLGGATHAGEDVIVAVLDG
eukprot:gene534-808_t